MFFIFIVLFILETLIHGNIDIWSYVENNIFTKQNTLMTGLTYISSSSLHFITYSNNSKSYFHIIEESRFLELSGSIILSPFSINLNNKLYIFTMENNNNLYYISNDFFYTLNYNDTSITRLRGMQFINSTITLIAFIGTNKINYYYYNNKLYLKTTYDLDYNIISFYGVPSSSSSGTVYLYYYINDKSTKYSINQYSNEKFYEILYIYIPNIILYNITEISKTIDNENSLLIFSYNKNNSNFYFYYYDYTDSSNIYLKSYGNKYNFLPFRDSKIINAFFLQNTEYLYYLIKKDDYYNVGVLDMENNLIIFNIQEVSIEFISIKNFNLVYGQKDTIYMVCPFNSHNPTVCNPASERFYMKISANKVNTYSLNPYFFFNYYSVGRVYFKNVPLGFEIISGYNIKRCSYFDIDYMQCVDLCAENTIIDYINGICYSCIPFNQYYNKLINQCVDDCSIYGLYSDIASYNCLECSEVGYYIQNNICVENCDLYYVKDEINLACINCQNDTINTPYYQDNQCVNICDNYYILDNFRCYNCTKEFGNKYYYNNSCLLDCPKYTLKDDSNKICYICAEKHKEKIYYENGECVEKCNKFYFQDIKNNICLKCNEIKSNLFYQDGECVEKCSLGYVNISSPEQACINCYEYNKTYEYKGFCLSECPIGTEVKNQYHICIKCEIYDEINHKCLDTCPNGTYPYYLENKNRTYCFNCFCGYGNCLSNDNFASNNNLLKTEDTYNCQCQNNHYDKYLIFGKFCQYKYYLNKDNILKIKPMQESVYGNKRIIFTFEIINDKDNNLRFLSIQHEQNINRRIKYKIKWILNDNEKTEQNNLFYILEPGQLKNGNNNVITLKIFDLNNKLITESELYIKVISNNINNYDIKINKISGFYPMAKNYCPKILVNEIDENNINYFLNYKYITKDSEEFSLERYVRNNYQYKEMIIPSSEKIKIEIKTDYNDIIYKEFNISFKTLDNFNKTLSNIINNYISYSKIFNIRQLLIELKNYFIETKSFDYIEEKKNLNYIINLIKVYLPAMVKYENNILNDISYIFEEKYEIIEPNYFISLLNQISLFVYNENKTDDICNIYDKINNILNISINDNITLLNEDTIISFLRTTDNLLTIMNKINCSEYKYSSLYEDFNILKKIISKNIFSGTRINIKGKNFNIDLISPSYYTEEISFNKEYSLKDNIETNIFTEYKNYKIVYDYNISQNMKCNNKNSIFCIDKINYDYLYDEITYLKNEKIINLIFSLTKLNNNYINQTKLNNLFNNNLPKQIVNYSFIIEIENSNNKKVMDELNTLRYNISFDLPKIYEKDKSDIACISMNSIKNNKNKISLSKKETCKTYFDVKNHKIICDCNTNGEIFVFLDKNLATLSKNIQFSKNNIKIINCLSGSIILSSLALILIFSVVLIRFDFTEDKINKLLLKENINKKVKYLYKFFKNLKDINIAKFSLYLLYYKYAFLNIFSTYKYDHPRHIRYFIEIIKILLNLIISASPFYYKPFNRKNEIINDRDIENLNTTNIPSRFIERMLSFLYSLFASIIIWIIMQIFYKILEFKKFRKIIWKPKLNILEQYIYTNIKKEPNFNKKFKKIKNRMKVFAKVCGKNILSKKVKDKYALYLEEKSFSNKIINISLSDTNIKIINYENRSKNNTKTELALFPDENALKEKLLNNSDEQNISFSKKSNSDFNEKSLDFKIPQNLSMIKIINFSFLSNNSSDHLKINTICKLEIIKSKYISINKKKDYESYNYASTNVVKYIDLELESLKNFTYIPSNKIYKNANILIDIKSQISMNLIVNAILFILLIVIDIFIYIIFKNIYEEYGNHIIASWLIPVIIQITINNFIINYLFALLCSFLLFNYYDVRKKNNCFSLVYNLIVEKYMVYCYKIKMLIEKYNFQYAHI